MGRRRMRLATQAKAGSVSLGFVPQLLGPDWWDLTPPKVGPFRWDLLH